MSPTPPDFRNSIARRPRRLAACLAAAIFALPVAGDEPHGAPSGGTALATVAGVPITVERFEQEMARRGGPPGRFATPEARADLLTAMVRREALYAAAVEAGYLRRPDVVEAVERLVIGKYREELLDAELARIEVGDDEAAAYYRRHPEEFTNPGRVRAAVIRIGVPAGASEARRAELRRKAEEVRRKALELDPAIRSFGGLAVETSDDQASRYRGGDAGPLTPDATGRYRWEPAVMEAIFVLDEPGEIGPVVTTAQGHYLVKLIEAVPAVLRPMEEVGDRLRHLALLAEKKRLEDAFFDRLAAELGVRVDAELLRSLSPPEAGGPPALPQTAREESP